MSWRPHFETTEDMDLGSLGGTLKAGAFILPATGNFECNVALLTPHHWEDRPEGQPLLIGGWPEAFEGKVKPVPGPSQESFERALAGHEWPVMPITWFDVGSLTKSCPRCHHPLNFWMGNAPVGVHWGECQESGGGCGAFWDVDEAGIRTSSLGPCEHKTMTVKCRQVSTMEALRELPEGHGYSEEAFLMRHLCVCGVTVDLIVPEPVWEVPGV